MSTVKIVQMLLALRKHIRKGLIMVFTPWQTAHGDAELAFLIALTVVSISPSDDSIDTHDCYH